MFINAQFNPSGACMDAMNEENVRDFCARIRNSNRCANRQNCNSTVRPTDGCCPVCGKCPY